MATSEPGEPYHANLPPTNSVWWKWTFPLPSEVTLETSGFPISFDTRLAVYTGTNVAALKSVEKDDNGGINNGSKLTFLAARGKTFHFAVDGNDGAEGPIELKLQARAIISPPVITNQPLSAAATDGGTVTSKVGAEGSPDLSYQWYYYKTALTNANDPVLVLQNVRTNDEGNYTATITNEYGATNSHIARLTYGSIIRGQVTDATNTNGIPGPEVRVLNVFTNTDENGNYTLVDVRPADFKAQFDTVKRTVYIGEPVVFMNRSTFGAVTLIGSQE
ncbi:MAG: immunoglobulin domain-containing protein, partial [Bacteroidota bacterium]